jgi:hypothetical protein
VKNAVLDLHFWGVLATIPPFYKHRQHSKYRFYSTKNGPFPISRKAMLLEARPEWAMPDFPKSDLFGS